MTYNEKLNALRQAHEALLNRKNEPVANGQWPIANGIYTKYKYPVLTADHTPLEWRYDFDEQSNPHLMQRIMINAVFNAGAILFEGKYTVVARVEGADRKSFFAVAQSDNGIDGWRFWDEPITMPDGDNAPATNVYDMRLTQHEDGYIYGVFCVERHDDTKPFDTSAATAAAGIARTKDLKNWERLPDLKSFCQQRNVVLHPEFIKCENAKSGKCYAFYTRPQDGFIETGKGGGIGWTLTEDITHSEVRNERIIFGRNYHTVYEVKNGEGPAPIKTAKGWLHLAHGVRATASGLRYVLYLYMTALDDPTRIIAKPGGWFLVPEGAEYVGDVMNVAFSNGWIVEENQSYIGNRQIVNDKDTRRVFIYYASSDTRLHVATSTVDQLLDYCLNTPEDGLTTSASVETIKALVAKNKNHQSFKQVLESNILRFWLDKMYDPEGGFYGRMDGQNVLHADAPRGTILYARILWTFSAAYRVLHNEEYLRAAQHAKDYIEAHMLDPEYGGAYWSVKADGTPLDTHKQIYAQAFLLYAYAEYIRATDDQSPLSTAIALFRIIERYGRDRMYLGYTEAAARDWSPIEDMRLSDKDENTVKSQNTNLHVLEAYTNLYRVWKAEELKQALDELIQVFETRIMQPSGHLGLFFDEQWRPTNSRFSAGHDIECSWLIDEAAAVIGRNVDATVRKLAQVAAEARHDDGSLGELDWWTQAETVVGYDNIYRRFGDEQARRYAETAWSYIQQHLIDYENGEWFWGVLPDGTPDTGNDKAGFWKCPYHNSRMCLKKILAE